MSNVDDSVKDANVEKKTRRGCRKPVTIIIVGLLFACFILYALAGRVPGESISGGNTRQASPNTAEEPGTPVPTSAPVLAPPISVFFENYEKMTDAQWEKFSDEVSGSYIDEWQGTVSQVDAGEILGGYDMYIDVTDDNFGSEVFISDISEDLALAFNKNQPVTFSGYIKFASNSLGMSIHLDKDTVLIEPVDNGDATR